MFILNYGHGHNYIIIQASEDIEDILETSPITPTIVILKSDQDGYQFFITCEKQVYIYNFL